MNPLIQLFNGERDFSLVEGGPEVQAVVSSLLEQIVLGDGVAGIGLVGLDVDNASFQVELFGATDTIVVDGIGGVISDLETDDFDVDNGETEFAVFDVDEDGTLDLGDGVVLDAELVREQLAAEISGDLDGIEILGIDQDNITVQIEDGGATDTLIIDGAEDEIAAVSEPFVDVSDDDDELGVFDASEQDFVFVGNSGSVSDEFEELITGGEGAGLPGADAFVVGETEAVAVARELLLGDGVEGVRLLNIDNDTATIEVEGDSTDIVIFDNFDFSVLTTDTPMA